MIAAGYIREEHSLNVLDRRIGSDLHTRLVDGESPVVA